MITIQFTDNEVTELNHERFHHPRVQRKMEALYLKAMGMAHHEICRLSRISANTLHGYFREFLEGGVDRLKHLTPVARRASWIPMPTPWPGTSFSILRTPWPRRPKTSNA